MNNPMPPQNKREREFVDFAVRTNNRIMDLLRIPVTPQRQIKMLKPSQKILRGRDRELLVWIEQEINNHAPVILQGLRNV
jgi:hypothetical protein